MSDKILISGDFGTGKTLAALSYTVSRPMNGEVILFDYERGTDFYVTDDKDKANPDEWVYYIKNKIKAPDLYDLGYLAQRILHPSMPTRDMFLFGGPVNPDLLKTEVKDLANRIAKDNVVIDTIIIDTITRVCEQTTNRIFEREVRRFGADKAERMSQLIWAKVKDDMAEMLYSLISADTNLIMTAWAKNKFDTETKRSTQELVADVLKNTRAFIDLELMLTPNKPNGLIPVPPAARVTKTRIRKLPCGASLNQFSWQAIHDRKPDFMAVNTPEEVITE